MGASSTFVLGNFCIRSSGAARKNQSNHQDTGGAAQELVRGFID